MEENLKRQAIKRLRIIGGQIKGLERMISEDKYCVPVIHQSLAAKEALSSFEDFILKNHLATHVAEQFKSGKKEKAVREVLSIYRLSKRK